MGTIHYSPVLTASHCVPVPQSRSYVCTCQCQCQCQCRCRCGCVRALTDRPYSMLATHFTTHYSQLATHFTAHSSLLTSLLTNRCLEPLRVTTGQTSQSLIDLEGRDGEESFGNCDRNSHARTHARTHRAFQPQTRRPDSSAKPTTICFNPTTKEEQNQQINSFANNTSTANSHQQRQHEKKTDSFRFPQRVTGTGFYFDREFFVVYFLGIFVLGFFFFTDR